MGWSNKMPFEQRLYLGKESSRQQEQKVQRRKVVAFTQNMNNVGESSFSDTWVITGSDFNLYHDFSQL